MTSTGFALPTYPPGALRASLTPTQLSNLNEAVSSALLTTLALPPAKRDTLASRSFIASFAKDAAFSTLESLIWEEKSTQSQSEKLIQKRVLLLAEKLACSSPGLDLQTLVDLAIVYARRHPSRLRGVFDSAIKISPSLKFSVEDDLLPAFTQLLENHNLSGLYGLRKTLHCILSFLQCAPDELAGPLFRSKEFIISLAKTYDAGLNSLAQSYGGLGFVQRPDGDNDWTKLWMECKAASVDIFYILMSATVKEISEKAVSGVTTEADRTFDLIFAMLELPSSSLQSGSLPPTPFLNQCLLADFQHSYDLSKMLALALKQTEERDARLDILDSALSAFSIVSSIPGRNPGALKILLHSSGVAPGIDNLGKGSSRIVDKGKGKAAAPAPPEDPELDSKVTQVLDILPEHAPDYVRDLLQHPDLPYKGNAEKVIEALLEGTTPPPESIRHNDRPAAHIHEQSTDEFERYVHNRANIFDDQVIDTTQVHTGKNNAAPLLGDRSFIEEMKADILRRAEQMSDEEDEAEVDVAYDAELEDSGAVKVAGDGEESGGEDVPGADEVQERARPNPQVLLELAYLGDPKLFDRDANTRRSKAREDLRKQTGWDNEQIEGWRVMLERDSKAVEKLKQRHEFRRNAPIEATASSGSENRGGRGGRGRGRGGGGGSDRRYSEKNKASKGNNNRKRGHDKKVAKAGGPS